MLRVYEQVVVAAINAADAPRKAARKVLRAACVLRVYQGPYMAPWIDDGTRKERRRTLAECAALAVEEGEALAKAIWGDGR